MNFLQLDKINVKNSKTWIACNDNSRSEYFRTEFIKKFGGSFVKENKTYVWIKDKRRKKSKITKSTPQTLYVFSDIDGNAIEITSIKDYCRERGMSNGALFDVVNGKKKSYKGLRFISKSKTLTEPSPLDLSEKTDQIPDN